MLDATSNNGLFGSNLPATFDRDQKLSLEGDFDQYFSLYCPEGYEQDALYLFTPDIMARFIDHAAALDVEIVDDWLFLYGKREFSSLDPATWAWLFSVVAALLDKFAQWARWRDEKLQTDAATAAATGALGVGGRSVCRGDRGRGIHPLDCTAVRRTDAGAATTARSGPDRSPAQARRSLGCGVRLRSLRAGLDRRPVRLLRSLRLALRAGQPLTTPPIRSRLRGSRSTRRGGWPARRVGHRQRRDQPLV